MNLAPETAKYLVDRLNQEGLESSSVPHIEFDDIEGRDG